MNTALKILAAVAILVGILLSFVSKTPEHGQIAMSFLIISAILAVGTTAIDVLKKIEENSRNKQDSKDD